MTPAHIPDDILDLLTGYALEALDDDEMLQAQQLLAERPDLRALVAELRSTLDSLPELLPEPILSAELRQRTLDHAVRGQRTMAIPQPTAQVHPLRRWLMLLGGLTAALALALMLVWNNAAGLQRQVAQAQAALQQAQQQVSTLQQNLAQAQTDLQQSQQNASNLQQDLSRTQTELELERTNQAQVVAALAGKNTTIALRGPGGTGTAVRTEHNAVMVAAQLPPLATGRTYQLWLIHDKVPVSAGTFQVDPSGHGTIMLAEGTPQADAYAITEEPEGGSPGPTTDPLLTGQGASARTRGAP